MNQKIAWNFFSTCAMYSVRVLALLCTLIADVACFYMSIFLPVPLSVCFYACMLAYGSIPYTIITFLCITLLPCVIPVSWVFFMVPFVVVTLVGLCARSLVLAVWPLPYCLAALYASVASLIAFFSPGIPVWDPHLTILSIFVILVVIKCCSLIVLTHPRQGNRS